MRTKAILSTLALAGLFGAGAPAFAQHGYGERDRAPAVVHRDGNDARDHRDHRDWRDARRAGPPAHVYGARGPNWRPGLHVPPQYRSHVYVVDNWRAHRLPAPRRGYHWIEVGSDFVLVANRTNVIVQVLRG